MSVNSSIPLHTAGRSLPPMLEIPETDLDAWRAEIERKRAYNAEKRKLSQAAYASQRGGGAKSKEIPKRTPSGRPSRAKRPSEGGVSTRTPGSTEAQREAARARAKYPPIEMDFIVKRREEGVRMKDIAAEIGVPSSYLSAWYSLRRPNREATLRRTADTYTREDVLELYSEYIEEGKTLKELGVTDYMAVKLFKREGLEIRQTSLGVKATPK